MPLEIFISYAQHDQALRDQLETHLSNLKRLQVIVSWYDGAIIPGTDWQQETMHHLTSAQIILLLISADFLASDICYSIEMEHALTRHTAQVAYVLPIILRPTDWQGSPFSHLQVLPSGGKPVTEWSTTDAAFVNVVQGIRRVIDDLQGKRSTTSARLPETEVPRGASDGFPPIWNVPYRRNPFFIGREDMLQALHDALRQQSSAVVSQEQTQAVSGLGGIGKTQTAVEYCYRYRSEYRAVFWTRAERIATLQAGFSELAKLLDLPQQDAQRSEETVRAVQRWLEGASGWLLVFDNADQPELLAAFLPREARGHVLLTSRTQVFDALGIARPLSLAVLSPEEAVTLLYRRTGRENHDPGEREAARQLAEEVGYLPLALEQASAYLLATQARFKDYLSSYHTQRLAVLNKARPKLGDYPASVATTWSLNVQEVAQTRGALDLLHLSAFLSPDHIPLEMLMKGTQDQGPELAGVLAHAGEDPLVLHELLAALARYSLIRRDLDAQTYSIHRLVQEVVKDGLDTTNRRLWAGRAMRILSQSFPFDEAAPWQQSQRLLPHALVCLVHIQQWDLAFPEAADLLYNVGIYFSSRGQYREARQPFERSLIIYEHLLGPDHPSTALSLDGLATLYRKQGDYEQARPLYERALAIYEHVLGPDHPGKAKSLNNLAILYREQGDYEQARPLYERALTIYEHVLGPDHPDTAKSLNNLATLYREQGDYEQARPLYERALAIYERALGPDHSKTAKSLNNLATLYREQGDYEQARPLYERALSVNERVLGPDHPSTAGCLNNLAILYSKQGDYERARPLYERALAIREHVLGPDHPKTLRVRENYRMLLQKMTE